MKKWFTHYSFMRKRGIKFFKIKKLALFFCLAFILQFPAISFSQDVRFDLNLKDVKLSEVLNILKSKTNMIFFYNQEDLNEEQSISVNASNSTLKEVLNEIAPQIGCSYKIMENYVIFRKEVKSKETVSIIGRVTDKKGLPLLGATVLIKGTLKGTTTDANGYYAIKAPRNSTLVFSFIGYTKQEVAISDKTEINVVMTEKVAELGEVSIVYNTGYQKLKKAQITGAASIIVEKDYQQRIAVTGDFLESLEGKIPGLVYNPQTEEFSIRGVSTFNATIQPLIVVDGFPLEIDLLTINPNDIVSVSVLRDAAAASIYGVRASNGVIVIETKNGKAGKPVFNLRATYAVQSKPDFSYLKYAPADEFVQLQKEEFNISQPNFFLYLLGYNKMNPVEEIMFGMTQFLVSNPLLTEEEANQRLAELGLYDNLKEYERLFYQNRMTQNINFDVSGGTERATYILGINYINETPVNRRSENQQLILNMGMNFKFSERIKFDFRGNYTNSKDISGYTPPYTDFFPYEHLADENGNALPVGGTPGRSYLSEAVTETTNNTLMALGLYDMFYYPYRELTSNTNTIKGSSIRFQGRLNVKITNWLNMDIGGKYENQNILSDQLQLEDTYNVRNLLNYTALKDPATGKALYTNMPQGNILTRTNQQISNYTLRTQLNVDHRFQEGDHHISGILGIEQQKLLNQGYTTTFFGYDDQTLISKPINMGEVNAASTPAFSELRGLAYFNSTSYFKESETDRRFMSYYGQGTYTYKGKYIATASFRIDQSNLFGADPKYKYKPLWSAGLNWHLSEEEFMKQFSWVDFLQIRTATGFNGNIPNSENGPFLILSTGLNTSLNTPLAYNDVLSPENQSLRWETTRNYNLGMDFTLLNSRISGSLDWYLKKTTDVFGNYDADPTSGFNEYNANTASIQNKGLELMLNTLNIKGKTFEWRTQLTASFNHNKVLTVKTDEYFNSASITGKTNIVKGYPINSLFSYNYGGLNSLGQPFVYDKEGNEKVLGFYGNSVVDVVLEDLIYNGTTTPKYVLGLNNQFTFGNLNISFLFMYYGGHIMRVEQPNPNTINSSISHPLEGSSNYWREAGDEENTLIPGYVGSDNSAPGYYQSSALYAYQYASQFVRKADHIRLRDLVITYNVKAGFIKKMGFYNTQLRFQAQNLFRYTFSGNDVDPDAINRVSGVRRLETQPFYSLTFSTNF